jgi:hypothetical protein
LPSNLDTGDVKLTLTSAAMRTHTNNPLIAMPGRRIRVFLQYSFRLLEVGNVKSYFLCESERWLYVTVCTERSRQVRMILPVVHVRSFIDKGLCSQYGKRAISDNNVQDGTLDWLKKKRWKLRA